MTDKTIRRKVEALRRQKMAANKVVNLADFRLLNDALNMRTILVVDDDQIMRNALKRMLEAEGYQVLLAEDGLELAKVLEKTRLDLLLLDVNLPWVDGYELCRLLKAHHNMRHVPIVFVSARKTDEDVEKGFHAGCNDYITKPFDIALIMQTLEKHLKPGVS